MTESTPQISVIVPMYNAEATISRCLKSLLDQAGAGIEVIVVDDGSTDGSARVVSELAAGTSIPVILHPQANQGPGAARNNGLSLARGRYICFLDADDYVADDFLAARTSMLQEGPVEIVLIPEDQDRRGAWQGPVGRTDCDSFIKARLQHGAIHSSVIGNLYDREFLKAHDIGFPRTYCTEDKYFSLCALMGARSVAVLPHSSYVVTRVNANSLSSPSPANERRLALAHWKISGLLLKKFVGVPLSPTKRALLDERAEYLLFSGLRKSRHRFGVLLEALRDADSGFALAYFATHSRKLSRRLRARAALGLSALLTPASART